MKKLYATALSLVAIATLFGEARANTCAKSGSPSQVHAVLLDLSDPLTGPRLRAYEALIERLMAELPSGGQFDVYFIRGESKAISPPHARLCKPLIPEGGGEKYWQRRLEKSFYSPTRKVLLEAKSASSGSRDSPIIESIYNIGLSSFVGKSGAESSGKIIVISDLLQNSETLNFYSSRIPAFRSLKSGKVGMQWLRTSRRVAVEIIMIPSESHSSLQQSKEFQRFWLDYATELFCDSKLRLLLESIEEWAPHGCN
jgi:hypothetical protein